MLIVTIHDVAPPHLAAVRALRERVTSWGVERTTLLVVPNHHGAAPLERCTDTVAWLRERAAAGDELALHGITHRERRRPRALRDLVRARIGSAGEAEMLSPDPDRPLALVRARAALEELTRAAVPGFVAPAWLEPSGFAATLARVGFRWHETTFAVEDLRDGVRIAAPPVCFATRTALREWAATTWARALLPCFATGLPARVALHPGDLASPAVMSTLERALRRLVARREAVTTSDALVRATTASPRAPRAGRRS